VRSVEPERKLILPLLFFASIGSDEQLESRTMRTHQEASPDFQRVGPHLCTVELPDVLHLHLNGNVERDHFMAFYGSKGKVIPRHLLF